MAKLAALDALGLMPAETEEVTLAQRSAIDPAVSVWVHASAGSGKTHVLTNRALRLLLEGADPSRLLCLTFTRAAAAEMKNRIFGSLRVWAVAPDDALAELLLPLVGTRPSPEMMTRARELFARVLDVPGGLKIETIHAFCESVLGRFPVEAGIAPHFTVMDERTAAELLTEQRARLLEEARRTSGPLAEAVRRIARHVPEQTFRNTLDALAVERPKLCRVLGSGGERLDAMITVLRTTLGLHAGETHETIRHAASRDDAFDGTGLRRAAHALLESGKTDNARGQALADWLALDNDARAERFDDYLSVFFTQKGGPHVRLATKTVLGRFPEIEEILRSEQRRLDRVRERLRAAEIFAATEALLVFGAALLRSYENEKRLRGVLDYNDLILRTRELLMGDGAPSWVLYKLDGGLDHILVDEAQDTNPDQWEIIATLADEFFSGLGAREVLRTVFVVGDVKQSIYSFQGADPHYFESMRSRFEARVNDAGLEWVEMPMEASFRSAPAVLAAVNAVFRQSEAAPATGIETFVDHRPIRTGHAGCVEVWPLETAEDGVPRAPWSPPLSPRLATDPKARLARRIASTISGWLRSGERLEARGRAIVPGDIMILVRQRDDFFTEMVATLKRYGIPVAGTDRMVLTDQLAVQDAMAAGRFALLPEDDLNLAVVLKGPFVGLDDDQLFRLAYDRGGASLWHTLAVRREETPEFRQAHAFLANLLARADTMPPYEFFADLLGPLQGRARAAARLGSEVHDPLDEFLNLALQFERSHPPSLESFLHWVESAATEVRRDLERGRNEVRVMTVHGAKGLEAPIVFLPDTCRVPGGRQEQPLLWHEDEGGQALLWSRRSADDETVAAQARARRRARQLEEYRRLLYVALTRAEDRLYVCGWYRAEPPDPGCWYELVRKGVETVATQVAMMGGTGLRIENPQMAPPEERTPPPAAPMSAEAELPPWATREAPAERAAPPHLAPSRLEPAEPALLSPLAAGRGAGRFRRGDAIHRLLQILPDLPPAARVKAAHRFLDLRFGEFDVDARNAVAAEVLAVLDDPAFARLFGPGSRAEVPLTGTVAGFHVAGRVDRLAAAPDGVEIVDYKTHRPAPATLADVPLVHVRQMALYRAVVQRLYPGVPVRCALLWTEGPRALWLPEARLEAALAFLSGSENHV